MMSWNDAQAVVAAGGRVARSFWCWCWIQSDGGVLRLRSNGQAAPAWTDIAQAEDDAAEDWIDVSVAETTEGEG